MEQLARTMFEWSALLLVFVIGLGLAALLIMYVVDVTQTTHAIRRNYPVVGRFRYWFEHLGEFFRQYFFAQDREELPFNRAERSWAYRAAKGVDTTLAFGSTRLINRPGDVIFLNSAFPILKENTQNPAQVVFGEQSCQQPYQTNSIIHISGMSFGALSKPALQALSYGAKQAGIWMNTGEGGLTPYHLASGCDLVFQIGTAKYGVRNKQGQLCAEKLKQVAAHQQVKMFEIKLSQGAKPGKGGILPGHKVTAEIAAIRGIEQGKDSISPNAHPEIKSVTDLLDMINMVRELTAKPVGIKLVLGQSDFLHDLFTQINTKGQQCAPDFITLDSADGGTGAAPQPLLDYVGLPITESLPLVVHLLQRYQLKDRIKVITSGKLITPGKVAWALAMGADAITSARGFMFALGCIQALQCNKNTCPTGITTHDKSLQRGLVAKDKSIRVAQYANQLHQSVAMIAHSCGVAHARLLSTKHIRIIDAQGRSRELI
ncbi:FMN-binding glutamate synthase family protein [Paraferrimonas sp. SM1919]|uniref:FMN-binding glutamate synthase family protein n=1 Tax=Paraferrimonas sp. SM1919 TaxID=2662263 RepID=UPI0013D80C02|nr:FMN-binding glutamate synthase family protein [Paraferrimonas sp. SM1919]